MRLLKMLYVQVLMLGVLLLTSKGAAGVTGSGFIVLAGTLAAVDGPPLATLVVSRWTGAWRIPDSSASTAPSVALRD